VHPSRHAIFDFLDRDLRSYVPILSSSLVAPPARRLRLGGYSIPFGKPTLKLLRRSKAFWSILSEHRIYSAVLRVPITFPAGEVPRRLPVVDVHAGPARHPGVVHPHQRRTGAGRAHRRHPPPGGAAERSLRGAAPGPENPIRENAPVLTAPLRLQPLPGGKEAIVELGGTRFTLRSRPTPPGCR